MNIVDILSDKASKYPDRTAFIFLEDGESKEQKITFGELDKQARVIAALLQTMGLEEGSRVLIPLPSGIDFIVAFMGCMYAGCVGVPCNSPKKSQHVRRLYSIIEDADSRMVFVSDAMLKTFNNEVWNDLYAGVSFISIDQRHHLSADDYRRPKLTPDKVAFLQYTSGSTSAPKGVMVTHENIVHNEAIICRECRHDEQTVWVGWLPFYHDMGLIGNILQPIYLGIVSVLMPPMAFLQKPVRWLRAITRFGGTTSGGPDFAFDLCTRNISEEEMRDLDLSSWKVAFNGAEPVRARTIEAFWQKFSGVGLRRNAIFPCYGMAEATLFIAGEKGDQEAKILEIDSLLLQQEHRAVEVKDIPAGRSQLLVSNGRVSPDHTLLIVDPATNEGLTAHLVGEIWVKSNSCAKGYWNRPELSREIFQAYTATGEGPFLRTGDLGFYSGGELFITGRRKDLIIINGKNYYPQDIESVVAGAHPALQPLATAAFGAEVEGKEVLVIVQEVTRSHMRQLPAAEIARKVQSAITGNFDIGLYDLVLIAPGRILKTTSGKIQRHACKYAWLEGSWEPLASLRGTLTENMAPADTASPMEGIEMWLVGRLSLMLHIPQAELDPGLPFDHYGIDSLRATSLAGELSELLQRDLSPGLLYDYPSISALVAFLENKNPADGEAASGTPINKISSPLSDIPIAIIGMECRFPGAEGLPAFWDLLMEKRNGVQQTGTRHWAGLLDDIALFDNEFFQISPKEARHMDPQQRCLLEAAWHAIEDAGLDPKMITDRTTAVLVGASSHDYSRLYTDKNEYTAYYGTGNASGILANRLSYFLDAKGPSLAVDTACSSSLVALHLACQMIRNQDADLAIVAGVNILLDPAITDTFEKAGMLSPAGKCSTFDDQADGYVRSEGIGVIVLMPLDQALRDGYPVRAVIKGSAVNQDGKSNGLTAPNGPAQEAVIKKALQVSGITVDRLSYLEAHGTGTSLGDPIEVNALKNVLGPPTGNGEADCILGSVKTNIGHLEAAAGMAGLIKTTLALQHKTIPANLHFNALNKKISLADSRLKIARETTDWQFAPYPRVAGVSSFGFGGTNAFVLLEEAPLPSSQIPAVNWQRPAHLLTISARSAAALTEQVSNYTSFLHQASGIEDFCYTSNTGRKHFPYRAAFPATDKASLLEALSGFRPEARPIGPPKIAFVFSGQGSQYAGMCRSLYDHQPDFREKIMHCSRLLQIIDNGEPPLEQLLFGDSTSLIDETRYTQPCLFAVEYSLAALLMDWGIKPDVLMGHSVGEYVAAALAGIFTLDEGLRLICARGRLMDELCSRGSMLSVAMDAKQASDYLKGRQDVSIAAINGPNQTVLSGKTEEITTLEERLSLAGYRCHRLKVSHGFHSPLMKPMLSAFAGVASAIRYQRPVLRLISNLSGREVGMEMSEATYWVNHVSATVAFSAGIESMKTTGITHAIEIGPRATLSGLLQEQLGASVEVSPLLRGKGTTEDWKGLMGVIASLYLAGTTVDWAATHAPYNYNKAKLPGYPFQRQHYWLDNSLPRQAVVTNPEQLTSFIDWHWESKPRQQPAAESRPSETRGLQPGSQAEQPAVWLIFANQGGIAERIAGFLALAGHETVLIDPTHPTDLSGLFNRYSSSRYNIIYMCPVDHPGKEAATASELYAECESAALSFFRLLRTMVQATPHGKLWLISTAASTLYEDPSGNTLVQSVLTGMGKSFDLEYPGRWGGMIGLPEQPDVNTLQEVVHQLLSPDGEDQVAFREGQRYVARLKEFPMEEKKPFVFTKEATYLITGGTGALGVAAAEWLSGLGARRIVLFSRSGLTRNAVAEKVENLRAKGTVIDIVKGDVGQPRDVEQLIRFCLESRFPLKGVLHTAGILDQIPLEVMEESMLTGALQPKIKGALLLREHIPAGALDFFIAYSSIAAVWGSQQQLQYAAANSGLNAFARIASSGGFPAISVNWGPWKEGGMALGQEDLLLGLGLQPLKPSTYFQALSVLLTSNMTEPALVKIDWKKFLPLYQYRKERRLFDYFREKTTTAAGQGAGAIHKALAAAGQGTSAIHKALAAAYPQERPAILKNYIRSSVAATLGFPSGELPDADRGLFEMGMDSIMAIQLKTEWERDLGISIRVAVLFETATINSINHDILSMLFGEDRADAPVINIRAGNEPGALIACIGIGCRFPGGADNPAAFWQQLMDKKDAITEVPGSRWNASDHFDSLPGIKGKMYSIAGGFLEDIASFDAEFFNLSPREARFLDPQQRLLLEVGYEALEHACYIPDREENNDTGVFIGITANDYSEQILQGGYENIDPYYITGNTLNAAAGRLSYYLGLQGPSLAVDTACSSSLVSIHLAVQSLRRGECSLALAGGVNLIVSPKNTIAACSAGMLSPGGHCRTFDAGADGYVRSEGAGILVLKRLADAQRDGDRILAVIRASAMNQDGASSGLTIPNGSAQRKLLRGVLEEAGLEGSAVDYVEAHGTGTPLGDPIELEALGAVYGAHRPEGAPLLVGAVKTNIGHLESAAGVAGVIKLVLSLQKQTIPAHLHFTTPNPHIDWSSLSLRIPTETQPWNRRNGPRLGGVSAFGFSGTNAHVLIEEAPEIQEPTPAAVDAKRPAHLLTISARSEAALEQLITRYATMLSDKDTAAGIGNICYTSNTGRGHFAYRAAFVGSDRENLHSALSNYRPATIPVSATPAIGFIFSGQGASPAALAFYELCPSFRERIEICRRIMRSIDDSALLLEDELAPLALFAVQFSLAGVLQDWGLEPVAALGEGIGEYVAAVLAGMCTLEEGIRQANDRYKDNGSASPIRYQSARLRIATNRTDLSQLATHCIEMGPGLADWKELLGLAGRLYCSGASLNWAAIHSPCHYRKTELPGYPFQRQRYWLDPPANNHDNSRHPHAPTNGHPLLGKAHSLAGQPGTLLYHTGISRSRPAYLAGHIIGGNVLFPATAYIEMALHAGQELLGQGCGLSGLQLHQPLVLEAEQLHEIQFWADKEKGFTIYHRSGDDQWQLLASGQWQQQTADHDGQPSGDRQQQETDATILAMIEALQKKIGQDPEDLCAYYEQLSRTGLHYDPDWQSLRAMAEQDQAIYGYVQLDHPLNAQSDAYTIHPVLLDGALHILGRLFAQEGRSALFIPSAVAEVVWLTKTTTAQLYVKAQWQQDQQVRVTLYDDKGSLLGWINGLRLSPLHTPKAATPGLLPQALYTERWEPRDDRQPAITAAALPPDLLAYLLHPTSTKDLPYTHAYPLDEGILVYAPERGTNTYQLIELLQHTGSSLQRLYVLTQQAEAVLPGEQSDPLQASLRPMLQVARNEYSPLTIIHIDHNGLDTLPRQERLADILFSKDQEPAIALRDGQSYVLRLLPAAAGNWALHQSTPGSYDTSDPTQIDEKGWYLVTGGTSGLGWESAEMLLEQGAATVSIISRTGKTDDSLSDKIHRYTLEGKQIKIAAIDVCDPIALTAWIMDCNQQCGRLRGIIHAAGIVDDALIKDMDEKRYQQTIQVKYQGLRNLLDAIRHAEPDFLITYSSASVILGSPGQVSYVSANAAMDAIIRNRNRQGLPGLSIQWGPWVATGMAERMGLPYRERSQRQGISFIQPADARQLLQSLIQTGRQGVLTVLPVHWNTLAQYLPVLQTAYYAHMVTSDNSIAAENEDALAEKADSQDSFGLLNRQLAETADRHNFLIHYLKQIVYEISDLPMPQIEIYTPMNKMGIDSLLAIAIKSRIKYDLNVELNVTGFLQGTQLNDLAIEISGKWENKTPDKPIH